MVDACAANGVKPFYGPFGDFSDPAACEAQFRNAFLLGCAGAWTLHPSQIAIAKKVFSPDPAEVAFARKILAAMPDGSGAVMIDGKMQDDATWKQARVIVDLARQVAAKDADYAALYRVLTGSRMGSRRRSRPISCFGKATVERHQYRSADGALSDRVWGSYFDPMRYNSRMTAKEL